MYKNIDFDKIIFRKTGNCLQYTLLKVKRKTNCSAAFDKNLYSEPALFRLAPRNTRNVFEI